MLAVTNPGFRLPEAKLLLLWCRASQVLAPLAAMTACQWVLFFGITRSNGSEREECASNDRLEIRGCAQNSLSSVQGSSAPGTLKQLYVRIAEVVLS